MLYDPLSTKRDLLILHKAPLKFETAPKILLYQTSSPAIQANTTDHQLSHAAPVPTDGYDPVLVERYFEALHYS